MLIIRFARTGKKNKAQFKITLQEHTIAPGGNHIEILGSYDPHKKKAVLKEDRIKYWLSQGVQMSDTVYNLFITNGLVSGNKRKVKLPAKKVEPAVAEAVAGKEVKAEKAPNPPAGGEEIKAEKAAPTEETKVEKIAPVEEVKAEEAAPAEEAKAE